MLEVRVRVNATQDGRSKAETLRQVANEFLNEAKTTLTHAASQGEQPPLWLQTFMSPTGWDYYHQMRNDEGHSDQTITASAEPAPHLGGVVGFSPRADATPAGYTHNGQGQRQRRESAQAMPPETTHTHDTPEAIITEKVSMQKLEIIRDYGRAHEWPALVLDGEEIIPAGRADWLEFVWLSHKKDQQRFVYEFIGSLPQ